jgi:hypothetical protein
MTKLERKEKLISTNEACICKNTNEFMYITNTLRQTGVTLCQGMDAYKCKHKWKQLLQHRKGKNPKSKF